MIPDDGEFIVRAGVGWRPGVVGRAKVGADLESPAGYAFQREQPVISNQLTTESRFRTPALLAQHGVKRAINVLVRGDGDRFGVLEVDSPDEGRFTEADLAFLHGFANLLGVAIERQRAEEALRKNEALLQQALEHQEVLTQEMGHRVKNSLSLVGGLLSMQSRMSADPSLQRALADAGTRVQTIAQVHDRLWRSKEIRTVNLAEFMSELCERFGASGPNHILSCEVAPITVPSDKAVSLGLLANELATNAFKHAYPGSCGEVQLSVKPVESSRLLRFEVSDRGVGPPPGFDACTSKSLGMKLIEALARQLGGRIEWQDGNPGMRFVLQFSGQ